MSRTASLNGSERLAKHQEGCGYERSAEFQEGCGRDKSLWQKSLEMAGGHRKIE
jgi:hypothetical protein